MAARRTPLLPLALTLRIRCGVALGAALVACTARAIDYAPADIDVAAPTNEPVQERWSSFLPYMKEEALARGYDLPLPFGISVVYNYMVRDVDVTDVRVGLAGAPPASASRFIDLGSNSEVNAAMLKADVWLFPFLNLYLLGGYVQNDSTSVGHATVPRPGLLPPAEIDFSLPTVLDGFVGGGGLTLAGGYKQFFMMLDANYTQTDMGFDDTFRAFVGSARAGWNGEFGSVPTRLWLGAAFWDTENTARGSVNLPALGNVSFEADQGPRNPWNMVVGASVVLNENWEGFLEYGFNFDDVNMIATGLTFRF